MEKPIRSKVEAAKPPLPAYFLSLTVSNVRCFGPDQTLDLSDGQGRPARWTVILGDNGTGKTTLLRLLADMVPKQSDHSADLVEVSPWVISTGPETTRFTRYGKAAATFAATYCYGNAALKGATPGSLPTAVLSYAVSHYPDGRPNGRADHTSAPIHNMVVFGYGANRPIGTGSLSEYHTDGTRNLMVEDSPLLPAEEWFLQQDYIANQKNGGATAARRRLRTAMRLLSALLPESDFPKDSEDILSFKAIDLSPSRQRIAVHVKTPYGEVQLRALSLGYRTLIAWTIDLAMQLFARYPDSKNPLHEPAVVLVDEIDLHLHPKWQRQLFANLSHQFPQVQFVVTAHSPLIVQAAGADANIVVVRRPEGQDHVVIDKAPSAVHSWRVDQILTSDLYGLPSARSPELDEKYARRRVLLRKPKLTKKEQAELDELEAWLVTQPGGETPEEMSVWRTLREVAVQLKAKSGRS